MRVFNSSRASKNPPPSAANVTIDLVDDDDDEISSDDVILIDDDVDDENARVSKPQSQGNNTGSKRRDSEVEIVGVRVAVPKPKVQCPSSSKRKSVGAASPWIRSDIRNLKRRSSSISYKNTRQSVDRAKKVVSNYLNRTSTTSKAIKKQKHKQQTAISNALRNKQLNSPSKRKRAGRQRNNQRSTIPIFVTDRDLGPQQWRAFGNRHTLVRPPDYIPLSSQSSSSAGFSRLLQPPSEPNSNIAGSSTRKREPGTLRPIIIDGSNVAVGHGDNKFFSCRGIQIVVEFFEKRNHKEIYVFVPSYRLKHKESVDTQILDQLKKKGVMRFTPSREVGGQRISSYDDKFIVQTAALEGGIIVSNDNYRDLWKEKPEWQETIQYRLLQFTWLNKDMVMFPEDPLGLRGPNLDVFLQFS